MIESVRFRLRVTSHRRKGDATVVRLQAEDGSAGTLSIVVDVATLADLPVGRPFDLALFPADIPPSEGNTES